MAICAAGLWPDIALHTRGVPKDGSGEQNVITEAVAASGRRGCCALTRRAEHLPLQVVLGHQPFLPAVRRGIQPARVLRAFEVACGSARAGEGRAGRTGGGGAQGIPGSTEPRRMGRTNNEHPAFSGGSGAQRGARSPAALPQGMIVRLAPGAKERCPCGSGSPALGGYGYSESAHSGARTPSGSTSVCAKCAWRPGQLSP